MASYILDKAHEAVRRVVKPGDTVIDATVGNGWDTVFLARLVGPTGRVIGFDIQTVAIDTARQRLAAEGLLERCDLFEGSHENPASALNTVSTVSAVAIMFNLGYLPGGDRSIMTNAATTVRALGRMVEVLAGGGIVTVVAYKGHHGAVGELTEVEDWIESLDQRKFACHRVDDPVGPPHAPSLFVVAKH